MTLTIFLCTHMPLFCIWSFSVWCLVNDNEGTTCPDASNVGHCCQCSLRDGVSLGKWRWRSWRASSSMPSLRHWRWQRRLPLIFSSPAYLHVYGGASMHVYFGLRWNGRLALEAIGPWTLGRFPSSASWDVVVWPVLTLVLKLQVFSFAYIQITPFFCVGLGHYVHV